MPEYFMQGTRFTATALSLILAVAGCDPQSNPIQPEQSSSSLSFPWVVAPAPVDGRLYVTAHTNVGNTVVTYESGGSLYRPGDQGRTAIDGGALLASSLEIIYDSSLGYRSIEQPAFGTIGTWGVAGNAANTIPGFADSMYMPAVIAMNTPTASATLSKATGVTLQWNADPHNDSVHIRLTYDGAVSHFADSTLPASLLYSWHQPVGDNGFHVIPASVLEGVPVGGFIRIDLQRGAGKVVRTAQRVFHLYGYSVASGLFRVTH